MSGQPIIPNVDCGENSEADFTDSDGRRRDEILKRLLKMPPKPHKPPPKPAKDEKPKTPRKGQA